MSDLQISVTEPTKCGDMVNPYISYKIITNARRAGFESTETNVIRRYSDFTWLCEDLARLYPGVIIPTLPEKQAVGRFSADFVESRRRALEKFLKRIADHTELGSCSSFVKFLQADDIVLNEAKEVTKSNKKGMTDKARSWLQGTTNALSAVTSKTKKVEIEKTSADSKIDEINLYINTLGKHLDAVYKHSENIVKKSNESATALSDFSLSLSVLGQTEGDSIGPVLIEIAAGLETFSLEASKHANVELQELVEPFEEYTRYVDSVKSAILRRHDKKIELASAQLDLDLKEAAYHKVMGIAGKEKDAVNKQDAVEKAQILVQSIKVDYDGMSQQLINEFALFKAQRSQDLKDIIMRFVTIEAEHNQKSEKFWSSVLPTLQSVDTTKKAAAHTSGSSISTSNGVIKKALTGEVAINNSMGIPVPVVTTTTAAASTIEKPVAKPTFTEV